MTGAAKQPEQAPEIEFWFEFGSNYSYLSSMRIEEERETAYCSSRQYER